jgi:hypothetical protein
VVLGERSESRKAFVYGAVTLYCRPFQIVRLALRFFTLRPLREEAWSAPATPTIQRSRALTYRRFGLFPVRSPLLGESHLLSVPEGTEMVHFPSLAPVRLFYSAAGVPILSGRVAPFGHPRVKVCSRLAGAYRSLLRPSSPIRAKASTVCP